MTKLLGLFAFFIYLNTPGCPDTVQCPKGQREKSALVREKCSVEKNSGKWKIATYNIHPSGEIELVYAFPKLEVDTIRGKLPPERGTAIDAIWYAMTELCYLGIINERDCDKIKYVGEFPSASMLEVDKKVCPCHAVGCYIHEIEPTTRNGKTTITCDDFIFVSECLFTKGSLDLDPSNRYLTVTKYSGATKDELLYYKYATNLIEAIEYVILHEYFHYRGVESDILCEDFAIQKLIEIRKHKQCMCANLRPLPYEKIACEEGKNQNHCLIPSSNFPDISDLPPGMEK